jgi:PKD repeat protein
LCLAIKVVAGNNQIAPATVDFSIQVDPGVTQIRYHFGDGEIVESVNKTISHEYVRAGEYEVYAEVKSEAGAYVSPAACAVKVVVRQAPLTKEGLGCSELVVSGDKKAATVSARLTIKGFGEIDGYRLVYDDGEVEEATGSGVFNRIYDKPGTNGVRGYVRGTDEKWLGGEGACRKYVYVYTAGMTSQPQTGVNSSQWVAILAALVSGLGLWRVAVVRVKGE